SNAFTNKAMRNIFPTIKDSMKSVIEHMEKKKGEEIDVQIYFREYTMDIISKLALGKKDCELFKNPYVEWSADFLNKPLSNWIFTMPSLFPSTVDFWRICIGVSSLFVNLPIVTLTNDINKFVAERKKQREAGSPPTNDIIDMFLDAEVDESEVDFGADAKTKNKLTLEEVSVNCKLFVLAGYDTTSITLSKIVHSLANYPEIQIKLREEIDDVIGTEDFYLDQLGDLRYAEAVIKETLRLHPLAGMFTTRECAEAVEINGYKFEKGDMIMPDVWTLHTDKDLWGEDAEEFRPERWLEDTSRDRASFLSFGEGPRICLGMKLAMIEMKTALVMLMKNFIIDKTIHTVSS
ncbi:hypothetical protein PFISCL1PPCAC_15962, partial [Pristionchus fissidentatus]